MMRPWETAVGSRAWETEAQLYPRTVIFKRPFSPSTYGVIGYQGVTQATEKTLIEGIPATIETASSGRNSSGAGLPADSPGPIKWTVTLPAWVMATLPTLKERDLVYDDLGNRFQVDAFQPTPLGAKVDCVRLTA